MRLLFLNLLNQSHKFLIYLEIERQNAFLNVFIKFEFKTYFRDTTVRGIFFEEQSITTQNVIVIHLQKNVKCYLLS